MEPIRCDDPPQPSPAVKRRRVALACDVCRIRKSRCDSSRPKCSSCRDLGFDCVYTVPTSASNVIVQKDYLQALESRLNKLEESMSTVKDGLSGLSSRVEQCCHAPTHSKEPVDNARKHTPFPDLAGTEDSVDAMGAITLVEEDDSGFFGPSSNVTFIRHLRRAIGHTLTIQGSTEGLPSDTLTYNGGFVSASRPPSPRAQSGGVRPEMTENDIFALPPSAEMFRLITQYFTDTGLMFPYIHPPTFLETYDTMLRQNFTRVRRTWLGLLNMVLAMAIITTTPGGAPANVRMAESDVFYQRSLKLCGKEILRGTTLEVVQYLLLMGQYLQGTQKSVQAWTVHGLAVKAALQLGLHSRDASRAFPRLAQEMRLRTWFGCVILDRTLSMTFGRPAAIPNSYVKLELPVCDITVDSLSVVDEQTSSLSLALYNATITLYNQIWNAIDVLYGQNLGCDPPLSVSQTVAHVFSLEQELFAWERQLPNSLGLIKLHGVEEAHKEAASDYDLVSLRFRIVLTLRFSNYRLLLHRPVLIQFLDACGRSEADTQQLQLLKQLGLSSMKICADSTMEIIDLVHDIVHRSEKRPNLLGAWWFSLYYTFNAALVILGILLVCREKGISGQLVGVVDEIRTYPFRAVAALLKLDTGNRMVDRCRLYLETFIRTSGLYGIDELSLNYLVAPSMESVMPPTTGLDISPLGMEFGEFMVDEDLFVPMAPG